MIASLAFFFLTSSESVLEVTKYLYANNHPLNMLHAKYRLIQKIYQVKVIQLAYMSVFNKETEIMTPPRLHKPIARNWDQMELGAVHTLN